MAECPACGSEEAYVGTLFVECPHRGCEFFTTEQAKMIAQAKLDKHLEKKENKSDLDEPASSKGVSWGGAPFDPADAGTGKIRYKQMTFDDISRTSRSDADTTPLATPAAKPKQADHSSQLQSQPPMEITEEELDYFAMYYPDDEASD